MAEKIGSIHDMTGIGKFDVPGFIGAIALIFGTLKYSSLLLNVASMP